MPGEVYLFEEYEDDDGLYLSGRFSGYCERPDGQVESLSEGLPANEAVGWGRERAARVFIRVGEDNFYYSAGEETPPDAPPGWPEQGMSLGRRLAPRQEHRFRSPDDPSIVWAIGVHVHLRQPAPDFPDRLLAAVIADEARLPTPPRLELSGDQRQVEVSCEVRAETPADASQLAQGIHERALRSASLRACLPAEAIFVAWSNVRSSD